MKINLVTQHHEDTERDERVKELMNDPVVKEHCESLDKQGIQYKIIPLAHNVL
jgi:hypothetical protein